MTNKSFPCTILIILAVIFSACKKNEVNISSDMKSAALGDCTSGSTLPYICFDSVLMDSRCPAGAVCVWQGTSIVKVSFHEEANTHTFIMSLKGFPGLAHSSDTTINGYTIAFTDLKPYPAIGGTGTESPTAYFSINH